MSCYVTRQALHHNHLFNSRRHISQVLGDPATDSATRKKLGQLRNILEYSARQGLNSAGAYRYYIPLEGDVVSYLVQAAWADKLESVTWWFPVTGDVPYLGFFEESEREEEAASLKSQGYDVWKSEASAFSGLGWFEDPVFSSFLRRSRASLAELIFHELVHRTLWVSGYATFNENLASYLDEVMTHNYLKEKGDSQGLEKYLNKKSDRNLYKQWLSDLKKALMALYEAPPPGGKSALLAAKDKIFQRFTTQLRPAFKGYDYVGKEPWNNARVLAASLYSPDTERFAKAHACSSRLSPGEFLKVLAEAIEQYDEPFEALDSLCNSRPLKQ